jgi:hypothetical protein
MNQGYFINNLISIYSLNCKKSIHCPGSSGEHVIYDCFYCNLKCFKKTHMSVLRNKKQNEFEGLWHL